MAELPKRKNVRLKQYDYSQSGDYFVTICAANKKHLFCKNVKADGAGGTNGKPPVGADSISARLIERTFIETIDRYGCVTCPIYVVMPNHFHCIIEIRKDPDCAEKKGNASTDRTGVQEVFDN